MKKNKGFTLIELIIAMVIFFMVSVSSAVYYYNGRRNDIRLRDADSRFQYGEGLMELLKAQSYTAYDPYNINGTNAETITKYERDFTRNYGAIEVYINNETYKILVVTSSWDTGHLGENIISDIGLFTIVSPDDTRTW